jgi:hypothetical protein
MRQQLYVIHDENSKAIRTQLTSFKHTFLVYF